MYFSVYLFIFAELTKYIDIVIGIDGDLAESASPAFSEAFYKAAISNSVDIAFFNAQQTYLVEARKEIEKETNSKEEIPTIKEPVMFHKKEVDPTKVFLF
jgi:hypothetical protein